MVKLELVLKKIIIKWIGINLYIFVVIPELTDTEVVLVEPVDWEVDEPTWEVVRDGDVLWEVVRDIVDWEVVRDIVDWEVVTGELEVPMPSGLCLQSKWWKSSIMLQSFWGLDNSVCE